MGRRCTICTHPERAAIDDELASGNVSLRRLALQYGLCDTSLRRHRDRHLSPALAALQAERETADAATLLGRIEGLIARAERLLAAAEKDGRSQAALAAIRELRALLELLGKASGELRESPQVVVNLQSSPEWLELRGVLFAALAAYPAARAEVASRLLQLEAGEDS